MNRGSRGAWVSYAVSQRPYRLREVSVAVGLEDSFLCRCCIGLQIPCNKIQDRLPCKKYIMKANVKRLSKPIVRIRIVLIWSSWLSIDNYILGL